MGVAGTVTKKTSKRGAKPNPEGRRDALIAVKCWAEYKAWVAEFAKSQRMTPSALIDTALVELARARAFREAPER